MDDRELIKSRIDIVEFINSFVPLKKKGRNFGAQCPFHNEKTPSFMVSPERQIFKCFGCGRGGDIFTFLMEFEKMTFGEAIRTLADRAGVKLTYSAGYSKEQKDERDILFEINHLSSEFYAYVLTKTEIGKKALKYLKKRGITSESINLFKIGYAPNSWESLSKFLLKKGYKPEDLVKAGVGVKGGLGGKGGVGLKDRFYGRLMFSLFDHRGNCVGFAGRVLPESENMSGPPSPAASTFAKATADKSVRQGKYINTSETPVYHKSEVLYGMNVTRDHIRREDYAVVVEGEIDLIKAYQAGTRNIVAIKGSALTEQQVALLKRYTQNIKICLDTDLAGKLAALRGISVAERADMNIKIVELVEGKDPDECITKDVALWKKSLKQAADVWEFYIKLGLSQYDIKDTFGKKRFIEFVFPKINAISNLVVRDHYVKRLAEILNVSEEVISREMEKVGKKEKVKREIGGIRELGAVGGAVGASGKNRREKLEEYLLSLILQSDDAKKYIDLVGVSHGKPLQIITPVLQKILTRLIDFAEHDVFTIQNFISKIPSELHAKVDELYLKDLGFENLLEEVESEIKVTVNEIKKMNLKEEIGKVLAAMRKADEEGPELARLNQELQVLSSKLKEIE